MTHHFAVGLSTVALLGGSAALASPAGPFDSLPDDVVPLQTVPPVTPAVDSAVDLGEELSEIQAGEEGGDEGGDLQATEEGPASEEDDPSEEDGEGWALGRPEEVGGLTQLLRVKAFCDERIEEAAEGEAAEGEAAEYEDGAEAVGVPQFCDVLCDHAEPNAHGRSVAEQARNTKRPQGGGPPEWANSSRPDDVPPRPPTDGPRGSGENENEDPEDDIDASVEPAGEDRVPGGPPAHANARANRG